MNFGLARAHYERQWFWGQVGFYIVASPELISVYRKRGSILLLLLSLRAKKTVWIERIFLCQVKNFAHYFLQYKQPRVCVCVVFVVMRY